ncbi:MULTISPECIES: hypothetical protein [Rhizobium]|nr:MULTISPECIES: hypothetical protein [Rhizobium]
MPAPCLAVVLEEGEMVADHLRASSCGSRFAPPVMRARVDCRAVKGGNDPARGPARHKALLMAGATVVVAGKGRMTRRLQLLGENHALAWRR